MSVHLSRLEAALVCVVAACSLPTEADVREATGDAAREAAVLCRQILNDEIPRIVGQLIGAAVASCAALSDQVDAAADLIEASRAVIAYDVLASLGCSWDGALWDCRSAPLICDRSWP